MIGGVMGIGQMSGVSGILPYGVYQYGSAARMRRADSQSGWNMAASSVSDKQTGQNAGMTASSVSGIGRNAGTAMTGVGQSGVVMAGRGANPEAPVDPVSPVGVIGTGSTRSAAIPFLREGMDPAELAVRMRMQYVDPSQSEKGKKPVSGDGEAAGMGKVSADKECQTCKERKYQDGSDDSGVSYQTPTHIDPDQAASAVRGHEMEHVVRERASAEREDRRVVSQSVTMHTAICPECGRVYVSGGTTRTTTASNPEPVQPEVQTEKGFSIAA